MLPWVSFCISTYQRPKILQEQLALLSRQTFTNFEVIISDNDPAASAYAVVESSGDPRFRYFHNKEDLGMIRSFNKSVERANSEFVVLVTDDDPVQPDFLATIFDLYSKHPGYSIYCGFKREQKPEEEVEIIAAGDFMPEILDPEKTTNILWSSAVIRKEDALFAGLIPDYGSPHLADHAFISLAGSVRGGVIINKMFSSLSSHEGNFSKTNLHYYVSGCKGFYDCMLHFSKKQHDPQRYEDALSKHLVYWFTAVMSYLKWFYYRDINPNKAMIKEVNKCVAEILDLPFMKQHRKAYLKKNRQFRFERLKRKWRL